MISKKFFYIVLFLISGSSTIHSASKDFWAQHGLDMYNLPDQYNAAKEKGDTADQLRILKDVRDAYSKGIMTEIKNTFSFMWDNYKDAGLDSKAKVEALIASLSPSVVLPIPEAPEAPEAPEEPGAPEAPAITAIPASEKPVIDAIVKKSMARAAAEGGAAGRAATSMQSNMPNLGKVLVQLQAKTQEIENRQIGAELNKIIAQKEAQFKRKLTQDEINEIKEQLKDAVAKTKADDAKAKASEAGPFKDVIAWMGGIGNDAIALKLAISKGRGSYNSAEQQIASSLLTQFNDYAKNIIDSTNIAATITNPAENKNFVGNLQNRAKLLRQAFTTYFTPLKNSEVDLKQAGKVIKDKDIIFKDFLASK